MEVSGPADASRDELKEETMPPGAEWEEKQDGAPGAAGAAEVSEVAAKNAAPSGLPPSGRGAAARRKVPQAAGAAAEQEKEEDDGGGVERRTSAPLTLNGQRPAANRFLTKSRSARGRGRHVRTASGRCQRPRREVASAAISEPDASSICRTRSLSITDPEESKDAEQLPRNTNSGSTGDRAASLATDVSGMTVYPIEMHELRRNTDEEFQDVVRDGSIHNIPLRDIALPESNGKLIVEGTLLKRTDLPSIRGWRWNKRFVQLHSITRPATRLRPAGSFVAFTYMNENETDPKKRKTRYMTLGTRIDVSENRGTITAAVRVFDDPMDPTSHYRIWLRFETRPKAIEWISILKGVVAALEGAIDYETEVLY